MTPQAQRIALATALGWEACLQWWEKDGVETDVSLMPDYAADLNACHEAEKTLFLEKSVINRHETPFHAYHLMLHQLCTLPPDTYDQPMKAEHWAICAPAPQRLEAMVRTLGLWDDGK